MISPTARAPARFALSLVMCGLCLAACTPALNWRETRPTGSGATALFPCKPDSHVRRVTLAGVELPMQLTSCTAADDVYALSHVDAGDADRATLVLQALRSIAADNVGGSPTLIGPHQAPGMTPHPLAQRWAVSGKRADGSPIQVQMVLFTKGSAVYQATVVGQQISADAAETFFAGLTLP